MTIVKYLVKRWKNYRYRFLPWIVFNSNNRSIRYVNEKNTDRSSVSQENVLKLFSRMDELLKEKPYRRAEIMSAQDCQDWQSTLQQQLGFSIERRQSQLRDGGLGVFVVDGCVPKDSIVSFYPGTVYYPSEPILLQSIGNRFVFRCADGVFIDGNDSRLSRIIFKSCGHRETLGPYRGCDMSWLTSTPLNTLAVGQYVNNCTSECAQNVQYQEVTLTATYPVALRKFVPNVNYSPVSEDMSWSQRLVVLVALRDINRGEELFSSYFTAVL